MKTPLTIVGANFGSDPSAVRVFLYKDSAKVYTLNVLSSTETEIQCMLGGGKTGIYYVVVFVEGVGSSIPSVNSAFSYKIVVTSISPSSGSLGGGYDLTITGYNFK